MLPRATNTRNDRESIRGKVGGRTHEISRLVGRSLRAVIDYKALGENTIQLDCDVLQADGGTRTAAITGAYVALADALAWAQSQGLVSSAAEVLQDSVAAVSVGIVGGQPRLDLHYDDDVNADTDMNVVMTGDGRFIEIQGTAEKEPFDRALLDSCSIWLRGLRAVARAAEGGTGRDFAPRDSGRHAGRAGVANPGKVAELRRILAIRRSGCRGGRSGGVRRHARDRGDGCDLPGQRHPQGRCGRCPYQCHGRDRRRSRTHGRRTQRHAGSAVRAVGRRARRR